MTLWTDLLDPVIFIVANIISAAKSRTADKWHLYWSFQSCLNGCTKTRMECTCWMFNDSVFDTNVHSRFPEKIFLAFNFYFVLGAILIQAKSIMLPKRTMGYLNIIANRNLYELQIDNEHVINTKFLTGLQCCFADRHVCKQPARHPHMHTHTRYPFALKLFLLSCYRDPTPAPHLLPAKA